MFREMFTESLNEASGMSIGKFIESTGKDIDYFWNDRDEIYDFSMENGSINSLEGLPENFNDSLDVSNNNITSLKGLPKNYNADLLNVSNNKLKNFKGLSKSFKGELIATNNKLKSLSGLENFNGSDLKLDRNNIKVEYLNILENDLHLNKLTLGYNNIKTLDGFPDIKIDELYLNNNDLTSLKGLPDNINFDYLNLSNNKLKNIIGLPTTFNGIINLYNNPLESLDGWNILYLDSNNIEGVSTSFVDKEFNKLSSN